jgi:AraC-like DNA-binding protein
VTPAKGRANLLALFEDLIEQRTEYGVDIAWRDLSRLAVRMHSIDPKWRPRAGHRRLIATELLREGVSPKLIANQLGISRTTLWRLREELASNPGSRRWPDQLRIGGKTRMASGADV